MATPIANVIRRMQGGYGLSLSSSEVEERSPILCREKEIRDHGQGIPLLEGMWAGGLAVCPSALEKWMSVAVAMGMGEVCRLPMASHF